MVDAVGSELAGGGTGGEDELTGGVQAESAGDGLGGGVAHRSQAALGIDGETGDAVVAPVGDVEKISGRGELDLGTGIAEVYAFGQGGDGLHCGEGSGVGDLVGGYAGALLV